MRKSFIVTDISNGDAGKGSVVDALAHRFPVHTVVRSNGGAQAAHNVVQPDGRHHTCAQFGSGVFVPSVRTHLSRFMILDPLSMVEEERQLQKVGVADAFARTTIDAEALVISPFQWAANRIHELARGDGRHGSCGVGIGETVADSLAHGSSVLRARDLESRRDTLRKLRFLQELKRSELEVAVASLEDKAAAKTELEILYGGNELLERVADSYAEFARRVKIVSGDHLHQLLREDGVVVFEGAQGVLLDEWYGFHPYTTWSTTTSANARLLLEEAGYAEAVKTIGVVRAYATRHGPGPFPTEDEYLSKVLPDKHNGMNPWQRAFRVGWFDTVATRYALDANNGVDCLAVTNVDRAAELSEWRAGIGYHWQAPNDRLHEFFETDGSERFATGIRVNRNHDLKHQEELGRLLGTAVPIYQSLADPRLQDSVPGYIEYLEEVLGVPVGLISSGMTARDKFFTGTKLLEGVA